MAAKKAGDVFLKRLRLSLPDNEYRAFEGLYVYNRIGIELSAGILKNRIPALLDFGISD